MNPDPATEGGEVATASEHDYTAGYEYGKTEIYCECLVTGAKVAASLLVHLWNLDHIVELIDSEGCRCRIDEGHAEGWASLWIYRHPWVEGLLDAIDSRGAPKGFFDNWVNGKLFGYSDAEIAAFCAEKVASDER